MPWVLLDVDAGATGAAVEANALQGSREVGNGVEVEGRVIRMLLGRRGSGPVRKENGRKGPMVLEVLEVGCQRLGLDVVEQGGEGAALSHPRSDVKQPRAVAVEEHSGAGPARRTVTQRLKAGPKAKVLQAAHEPRPAGTVVRLLKIQEDHTALAGSKGHRRGCLQPVHLLKVEEDVVSNVAARDKSRLRD